MNIETSDPVATPGAVSPSTTLTAVGSPDTDADATMGSQAFSLQLLLLQSAQHQLPPGCQDTEPQGHVHELPEGP